MNMGGLSGHKSRVRAATLLSERGLEQRLAFWPKQLSGGEKQRVSIARALANQPKLILADEPTANLDSKHGHDTLTHLRAVAKDEGHTVVIVSHDHRIREIADRVRWLEDGRFRDMARYVADPVCGMQVEVDKARASIEHEGETFYFCSKGCSWEFEENRSALAGKR
jgi:putative ABC transport system ATP-binding protein